MMSEEERDIDVEDDADLLGLGGSGVGMSDNKRALHNAMERKRRDSIKDSFRGLQDCIPTLRGDKTSRAQVLKKTGDYISSMQQKIAKHQSEINELKNQNTELESQIRAMEKKKSTFSNNLLGNSMLAADIDLAVPTQEVIYEDSSSDTNSSEPNLALPQINLVNGNIVKTISGVKLASSSGAASVMGATVVNSSNAVTLGNGNTVTLAPNAAVTIAPGHSLLHPTIRVQPGQSLLLSEPMRKKKKII